VRIFFIKFWGIYIYLNKIRSKLKKISKLKLRTMADFNNAKQEIQDFQTYLGQTGITPEEAPSCYLITREEIDKLLSQKEGASLDGLRIYVGVKKDGDKVIPTVHVVACEKEGEVYNDFQKEEITPLLADQMPCPPQCAKSIFLDS
jgi:hypothetical protein